MISKELLQEALLIRTIENKFLDLFSQGKLNGTVHTCVGQEFSAIAFAGQLNKDDFVFSNHRCHGHFVSFTKDARGLIAELLGKKSGVCAGVGSSQHLCKNNFFSNGIQGGLVPVAAGMALGQKLKNNSNICVVFIGDGTLGQGIVYETMNIISKWGIPLLIVCEDNQYAQSTHKSLTLAGDILKRAEAFGIKTFESDTWNTESLLKTAKESIDYVRKSSKPVFHLVHTYRLNPHSKSDDNRDQKEIEKWKKIDPLNLYENSHPEIFQELRNNAESIVEKMVRDLEQDSELAIEEYVSLETQETKPNWKALPQIDKRQVELLNTCFDELLKKNNKLVLLGEDILSPYGGAFKVTKNLSTKYPDRVFGTPISEAAITGMANGLALAGFRPFVEIMFGDFITLAFDQIINHASKFHHMYNKKVTCPIVLRTPMGGGRGYGPTHSQTLDKFLVGIDNVRTLVLNTLIDPGLVYKTITEKEKHPVIVIENKRDYGKKINSKQINNYVFESSNTDYPVMRIRPLVSQSTLTIVTFGGMTDTAIDCLEPLFHELDQKSEILVLTQIHPLDMDIILESVKKTQKLFVIEEGSFFCGIGSEIIATVTEKLQIPLIAKRITSLPVPIPSVNSLENRILPNVNSVIQEIKEALA